MRILNMKNCSYPKSSLDGCLSMPLHVIRPGRNATQSRWALAVVVAAVSLMSGCASIGRSPGVHEDRPLSKPTVTVTREAVIPGTPDEVFAFIVAEDVLPKVLTGYGPLPAVVRTSDHTGPWDQPGSARRIHLADGTTVQEQVTHFARPNAFAYRVWDFGNPIVRTLADHARGEWTFVADPHGTKVRWTYTFTAKNRWTAVPLSGIAHLLWRGYMDVCLKNSARLLGEEVARKQVDLGPTTSNVQRRSSLAQPARWMPSIR